MRISLACEIQRPTVADRLVVKVMRSIELLGKHVTPTFKETPAPSQTVA